MSQTESRTNFIPTDHERRVLLELIQSPQESLESIAHELKISLAALTIYLATDDAASLFAQADLAIARRARTHDPRVRHLLAHNGIDVTRMLRSPRTRQHSGDTNHQRRERAADAHAIPDACAASQAKPDPPRLDLQRKVGPRPSHPLRVGPYVT